MNNRALIISILGLFLIGLLYFTNSNSPESDVAQISEAVVTESADAQEPGFIIENNDAINPVPVEDQPQAASPNAPALGLNSGNFESFVLKCFQGEKCKFADDPLRMYREFKSARNEAAMDNLIAFMRAQLKNPEFRERYQDILLDIIHDFYPPEEIQFQEASYYDYLGDKQKSLDIYLNLEKKAKLDSTLRAAPNLNIANVLYDLKRFKEALPYYQAALQDYLSGQVQADPSPVGFIEDRISEIGSK